ncbi:MAG: AI-2E family transporter [Actinomycetota bacterium]|nr:AI-2E family transporter [Actinomycetota bacterium]
MKSIDQIPQRAVQFRPRAILVVLGVILAAGVGLWTLWIARSVVTWILIALFLALALNPAVEFLQRRGVSRRGLAVAIVYVLGLLALTAVGFAFIPTLVSQVSALIDAFPGYVRDVTAGRGPLGFLERDYQVVEKVQKAIDEGGSARLAGGATAALSVTRSVATGVAATLTIAFMTLFMLLEGRTWIERFFGLLPLESEPRWRSVGHDIYRTIGGYVTGNLLISLVAGVSATIVLLIAGVPYAIALGVLVALLDLIPLAGAVIAMVLVSLVALTVSTTVGLIIFGYFLLYSQFENQVLQPIVYGRTVNLSPLAVLISVLIGAQVAGVLGALGAIPVAGAIQVLLRDWHSHRQRQRSRDDGDIAAVESAHTSAGAEGDGDSSSVPGATGTGTPGAIAARPTG